MGRDEDKILCSYMESGLIGILIQIRSTVCIAVRRLAIKLQFASNIIKILISKEKLVYKVVLLASKF